MLNRTARLRYGQGCYTVRLMDGNGALFATLTTTDHDLALRYIGGWTGKVLW